jgi:hypothetical protein
MLSFSIREYGGKNRMHGLMHATEAGARTGSGVRLRSFIFQEVAAIAGVPVAGL